MRASEEEPKLPMGQCGDGGSQLLPPLGSWTCVVPLLGDTVELPMSWCFQGALSVCLTMGPSACLALQRSAPPPSTLATTRPQLSSFSRSHLLKCRALCPEHTLPDGRNPQESGRAAAAPTEAPPCVWSWHPLSEPEQQASCRASPGGSHPAVVQGRGGSRVSLPLKGGGGLDRVSHEVSAPTWVFRC